MRFLSSSHSADLDEVLSQKTRVHSIPVRKTPLPSLWDQYLLYGIQRQKRSHDEMAKASQDEPHASYLSLCLTEEELENNNYMVIKSAGGV